MGIVVTIVMLFGLLTRFPVTQKPWAAFYSPKNYRTIWVLLILLGTWNGLWYGLQNLHHFWGIAGFVSGITMILAGIQSFAHEKGNNASDTFVETTGWRAMTWAITVILGSCFLLYSITLIQLNLGYPIIH